MPSFDSVEQCVCEREAQSTMTASEGKEKKKKKPLQMHHDGAPSRGATTTNKIPQHALDAVVGLLAQRLESVVIHTFQFILVFVLRS